MSRKRRILVIISFIFIIFGSLWFLTDDINDLSNSLERIPMFITHLVRDIVKMLRTIIYIILLIISFVGLLKNKKLYKVYFITFIFLAFYNLYWIPEFVEYFVSLVKNQNYVMTKLFGFSFTFTGSILLGLLYSNKK